LPQSIKPGNFIRLAYLVGSGMSCVFVENLPSHTLPKSTKAGNFIRKAYCVIPGMSLLCLYVVDLLVEIELFASS
jgi:hypothetical protein